MPLLTTPLLTTPLLTTSRLTTPLLTWQIFPGHEYTEMLLSMAVRNEPMNAAARRCLRQAQDKRKLQQTTVPSTMADELDYNPHTVVIVSRAPYLLCLTYNTMAGGRARVQPAAPRRRGDARPPVRLQLSVRRCARARATPSFARRTCVPLVPGLAAAQLAARPPLFRVGAEERLVQVLQ